MLQITDTNDTTSVIACAPGEVASALHTLFEGHPPYMHSTIDELQVAIDAGDENEITFLSGCLALTVEQVPDQMETNADGTYQVGQQVLDPETGTTYVVTVPVTEGGGQPVFQVLGQEGENHDYYDLAGVDEVPVN